MTIRAITVSAYTDPPEVEDKQFRLGGATMDLLKYPGTYNQAVADCVATLLGHFGDKMKSFKVVEVN